MLPLSAPSFLTRMMSRHPSLPVKGKLPDCISEPGALRHSVSLSCFLPVWRFPSPTDHPDPDTLRCHARYPCFPGISRLTPSSEDMQLTATDVHVRSFFRRASCSARRNILSRHQVFPDHPVGILPRLRCPAAPSRPCSHSGQHSLARQLAKPLNPLYLNGPSSKI